MKNAKERKMKTKTGYISFLKAGDEIKCTSRGEKIRVVINKIIIEPNDKDVLIYIDHYNGDNVIKDQCISLNDLHRWFDDAKWSLIK